MLVCWLYSSALTQLPALVRQWWTGLDARITQIVEKVTSFYVSRNLISQELNEVMKFQNRFKNMVVRKSLAFHGVVNENLQFNIIFDWQENVIHKKIYNLESI